MAKNCSIEGSNINNCNTNSLITHIHHDHIFSILLLLPLDSILSFAMTCRRFSSLVSSETLWESIFKRDCGNNFVDSLLGSTEFKQFSWKKLYQQVSQLDSVSCRRFSAIDDMFPRPRASHSLNLVSDFLVLFGGGYEGGRHLDDTWMAYIGNDFRRVPRWQKINSGNPNGRFGQTCVVIGDTLVLFGGINENGIRQNDTWAGQIMRDEMGGIKLSWRLLDAGLIAPPPRGAHAGCCVGDNGMVIHGGIGLDGVRLNDTWLLDLLSNGGNSATWREIVTRPSPPARSGHTLTCIGGTRMVLFGGRGMGYEALNDVWLFDIGEEYPKWVQLLYRSPNIPEGVPLPRVGHSATLILGGQVLIYGGEDSYRHRKDDFWALDVRGLSTLKMWANTMNSRRLPGKVWKRLKIEGHRPNCRSFHRVCTDHSGRCVFVFGGMVDGMVQPAESSGLIFDGEFYLVELVLQLLREG